MPRARKEQKPARDPTGKWRRKVGEMAERLGWQESALWRAFDELACMIEFEQRLPRHISEHGGWRLLRGTYDKQGMIDPD